MKYLSITTALMAVLAMPALAQDTTEGSNSGLAALSTGTPEVGSSYVRSEHGDWELRCLTAPEGQPDPCQLYQLLTDEEGNPVAEFNYFDVPDEGELVAGATIVTPLDTLLTGQLRMAVDSNQPRVYPFSFCQQIGCYVRLGLTAGEVAAFRAGNTATVAIVPLQAPDQLVPLSLSLSGFTAGQEALEAYNVEAIAQLRAAAEAAAEAEGEASE